MLPAVVEGIHRPSVVVVVGDSHQVPAVVHSPVAADTDGSSAVAVAVVVVAGQGIVVAVACQVREACFHPLGAYYHPLEAYYHPLEASMAAFLPVELEADQTSQEGALQGVLEAFAVAVVVVDVEGAHLAWNWVDGIANSTGEACGAILTVAVVVVVEVDSLGAANWQFVVVAAAVGALIRDDCSSEAE